MGQFRPHVKNNIFYSYITEWSIFFKNYNLLRNLLLLSHFEAKSMKIAQKSSISGNLLQNEFEILFVCVSIFDLLLYCYFMT